jgi:LDH2 family malate/lactate/ureidoglycolate dehydrogenase
VLTATPPGSILPTGGLDHGHKGFAMGLLVEALTNGLSGSGRRQAINRWTVSVYVQVIDPEFAGGLEQFVAEATHLAQACRQSRPAPGHQAVRMPGDAALSRKRAALASGIRLRAETARAIGLGDPAR